MSLNGSGPASVATDVEAREFDQLGGSITFESNATASATQAKPDLWVVAPKLARPERKAVDWKQVALDAWQSPSWRDAAVEYHRDRPPTLRQAPDDKLIPVLRDIWCAAGQCVRRKAPHDALRTFLKWCDCSGVERNVGLPIFKTIVAKELAK
jgi:hypothetical protein